MELPFISSFMEGLKLFLASKRLKWLTLIFVIGAIMITLLERLVVNVPWLIVPSLLIGGFFPIFFMITAFVSVLGFQRYIASDESYMKSFSYFIIWAVISEIMLIILWVAFFPVVLVLLFGVAFLGWIIFQSYYSTRSAISYAGMVEIDQRTKLSALLFGFSNIFNYIIIIGAFIGTLIFVPDASGFGTSAFGWAIVGMLLALVFNFLNGFILTMVRNKSYAENFALLGTFISLYSGYFIYNVLKPFAEGIDYVGIAITVFFILYTMSSVGKTLASRADKETRFKISRELAATFTFFMAAGYMFVDAMFTAIITYSPTVDASLAGAAGDAIKLIMFPFIALIMEVVYIFRSRKQAETPSEPEAVPVTPLVEEPIEEPEEIIVEEEPAEVVEPTPTYEEPEEVVEDIPEADEEPVSDEDDDSPEFE